MGTSDYSDLAEQPLAPFKHGPDVLISATTNRPVKEAGIKPHVYWCEICKIKLTHAMSAIAHFAGTFHLKKAGFLKEPDANQQALTPGMKRTNPDSNMQYPQAPHMNNASSATVPPAKIPNIGGAGFAGFVGGGNLAMNNYTGASSTSAVASASSGNSGNYYWGGGANTSTGMGNAGNSTSNSTNYTMQRPPWESDSPANIPPTQPKVTDYRYENPRVDSTGQSNTYQNVPDDGVKSYSYQDKQQPRTGSNPYSVLGSYPQGNGTNAQYTNVASRYGGPPPNPSQPARGYSNAPSSNITGAGIASALETLEKEMEKTVYCHNYNKNGHCPFGDKCNFKHEKAPTCRYDQNCTRQNCGYFHNPKPDDQADDGKAKAIAERVTQLETIIQQMSGSNIDPSIIEKLNTELSGLKNSL